jgi:hypothetical protein
VSWQDVVLALGGFVLATALVPALRAAEKPPLRTSFITGSVLAAFTVTLGTLGLWLATVPTAVQAVGWLYLGWQRLRRGGRSPSWLPPPGV